MKLQKIFKTIPGLALAAAILLSGVSAFAAGDKASAKAALDSAPQMTTQLSIPDVRAVSFDQDTDRQSGNNNCTPSSAIQPGRDFSPKIDDSNRTGAIIDLLDRIANCKPLPFDHDGIINQNKEGKMPQAAYGFYKEYTLMVPGRKTGDGAEPIVIGGQTIMSGTMQSARGPERIIIGGGQKIYYTPDHYKTFIELKIVK